MTCVHRPLLLLLLLLTLLALGAWNTVSGLRCYQCNAPEFVLNCPNPDEYGESKDCKSCLKIDGKRDGERVVMRYCNYESATDECRQDTQDGVSGTFCHCTTQDLCNAAPLAAGGTPRHLLLLTTATATSVFLLVITTQH